MFVVTDVVPNPNPIGSRATGISGGGLVIGVDGTDGFVWVPNQANSAIGSVSPLPKSISPGGPVITSEPRSINAAGEMVGNCGTFDASGADVTRAFSFKLGDVSLVDLGTFNVAAGTVLGHSAAPAISWVGLTMPRRLSVSF